MLQSAEVRASLHLPDDVGREQAWIGMAAWLGQWELRGTGQWAVVERATGAFLGRAGMHLSRARRLARDRDRLGVPSAPVGQGLRDRSRRGLGRYAFAHHDVDALYSVILPENTRSQAVAQRLGFTLFETRITSHFPSRRTASGASLAPGALAPDGDVQVVGDLAGHVVLAGLGLHRHDAVAVVDDGRLAAGQQVRGRDEAQPVVVGLEPFAHARGR